MTQYKETNFYLEPCGNVYKLTNEGLVKIGWENGRNYIHITTPDRKSMKVHRMIAETFIPNPKGLPHINHINGIRNDNRVENLEWVSPSSNQKHAYRTGLRKTKLTLEDVKNIRVRIKNGEKQSVLAEEYNIGRSHISNIVNEKRYEPESN